MNSPVDEQPSRPARLGLAGYLAMLVSTGVAFWIVAGQARFVDLPPEVGAGAQRGVIGGAGAGDLLHVLMALAVVIGLGRLLGAVLRRLGQPTVVGEILAGIALGPSLLGRIAPEAQALLLPPRVAPLLGVLAQVGVILYMFLVGLELDPRVLRERGPSSVATAHASMVVPFVLGASLALFMYPHVATRDVSPLLFALFIGVALSVTALPVLARILADRGIAKTAIGAEAIACAAVVDVTAWCALAIVVGMAQARVDAGVRTVALTAFYLVAIVFVVGPLWRRFSERVSGRARLSQAELAIVLLSLLASALVTEAIGVHAIFGAFLLGAVIPHDSVIARDLEARLGDLVAVLLLPAFFAFAGLRTQIGLVDGAADWLICGAIVIVASVGKLGGTAIAARLSGSPWSAALQLGVLMNARGLMEIIVLNIGLDLGVITPRLFTMMLLMAIVTTVATGPVLTWLRRADRGA